MKEEKRIRMYKTQNAIEKRKRIIRYIWNNPEHPQYLQEGRLRKYNFTCDCGCCRKDKLDEKYHPRAKYLWYYRNYDMDK